MLKVVYVCSTLERTGPINVLFNLVSNFNNNEIEYFILTLSKEGKDSRYNDFEKLGITINTLNLDHSNSSLFKINILYEFLSNINPDICHSFGLRADVICSNIKIQSNFNVVSSIYNYPYDDYPMLYGKIKGKFMAYMHIRALKKYKKVITCSDFIVNKLQKHGITNIKRIYTGVDSNLFIPLNDKYIYENKNKNGVPEDSFVFLFIGYLIKRKDPVTLVRSFKKILSEFKDQNKSIFLVMMGDGPLMKECKELYDGANIIYLGNQPNTINWLEISDVYISPSLSEGFPTAVLEALAMGLPCLLSDIMPHNEMIKHEANSKLFEIKNDVELVQLMKQSIRTHNKSVKTEIRNYFLNNFSANKMSENHLLLYKDFVNGTNTF